MLTHDHRLRYDPPDDAHHRPVHTSTGDDADDGLAPGPETRLKDRSAFVERIAWGASLTVIAIHVWLYRFEMVNLDGVSYLELGWAWREGRWHDAVNGYWSPLYGWVLAAALGILSPSPYWEYPVVHLVNALGAVAALGAFAYLVRGFGWTGDGRGDTLPRGLALAAAYSVFLWSSVVLLVVWMESPDMLLAAFVYVAAGALVRIAGGDRRNSTYLLLGCAAALGYLTKAAMMPIAAVFFLAAALIDRSRGSSLRRLGGAVLVALIVAAPWVAVLSWSKGRLTFGDAGRINYVWFVNGSEDWPRNWPAHWPHWSGDIRNGAPAHPARRLSTEPAVYEFAAPVAGTYPMWFDPSVWYEGVRPYFDPLDQLRRIRISLGDLYRLLALNPYNYEFFNPQPALLAVLVTMVVGARRLSGAAVFRPRPVLWMPSLAAVALYALVYIEPRYLGAFVALMWVLAIAALRPPHASSAAVLCRVGGGVMTAVLVTAVMAATWIEAYPAARRLLRGEPDRQHSSWITAERMRAAGVHSGQPIAIAGDAQAATRWAHLLRTPIVAEVPGSDAWKLWDDAAEERAMVAAAFQTAGARWFLLEQPVGDAPQGWFRVDGTPFLIRSLR